MMTKKMVGGLLAMGVAFGLSLSAVAGLAYSGKALPGAGSTLEAGKFYNLTANTTINGTVTTANPNGSGLFMPANGKVAINLNGYTLTVNGAAGSGTRGGGAGIQMAGGSTLYICGNNGQFTAKGGAGAAGTKGNAGNGPYTTGSGNSTTGYSGDGGTGGAGGGGGGAGVGTVGGAGGSGAGGGGGRSAIGGKGVVYANGWGGAQGAAGGAAPKVSFTLVCVNTLK